MKKAEITERRAIFIKLKDKKLRLMSIRQEMIIMFLTQSRLMRIPMQHLNNCVNLTLIYSFPVDAIVRTRSNLNRRPHGKHQLSNEKRIIRTSPRNQKFWDKKFRKEIQCN